jgi:hypothetical protein
MFLLHGWSIPLKVELTENGLAGLAECEKLHTRVAAIGVPLQAQDQLISKAMPIKRGQPLQTPGPLSSLSIRPACMSSRADLKIFRKELNRYADPYGNVRGAEGIGSIIITRKHLNFDQMISLVVEVGLKLWG